MTMDPDACLAEIRELIVDHIGRQPIWLDEDDQAKAETLFELVDALDDWIARGGTLPAAWKAD